MPVLIQNGPTRLLVQIFGGQSTVPLLRSFGIRFCYFVKTCVEHLKKHDHQSFERVCKESEVCRRTGRNCLNVSKLLVNNTKNLSSDYNLGHCRGDGNYRDMGIFSPLHCPLAGQARLWDPRYVSEKWYLFCTRKFILSTPHF